jgi:hypothetical protein
MAGKLAFGSVFEGPEGLSEFEFCHERSGKTKSKQVYHTDRQLQDLILVAFVI